MMFTGIVQAVGKMRVIEACGGDVRLRIETGTMNLDTVNIGDSIAVNGCCLTVIEKHPGGFAADASRETLSLTTLGGLKPGDPVNLETALTLSAPLGGHLVIGHVDGVGTVRSREADGRSVRFGIESPMELMRYIARKGCICVDGVSLTVNGVQENIFEVNIIPHTSKQTIMGSYRQGTQVNLEVDLIARYLERMLPAHLKATEND